MKWEYSRLLVRPEVYLNPINEDWIYKALDGQGEAGWELVTVDDGIAYFKRPKEGYGEEEKVEEAQSKEDTDQSQGNSLKGQLYSRAYERCSG